MTETVIIFVNIFIIVLVAHMLHTYLYEMAVYLGITVSVQEAADAGKF